MFQRRQCRPCGLPHRRSCDRVRDYDRQDRRVHLEVQATMSNHRCHKVQSFIDYAS